MKHTLTGVLLLMMLAYLPSAQVYAGCKDTWSANGADTDTNWTCRGYSQVISRTKHWKVYWLDGYERDVNVSRTEWTHRVTYLIIARRARPCLTPRTLRTSAIQGRGIRTLILWSTTQACVFTIPRQPQITIKATPAGRKRSSVKTTEGHGTLLLTLATSAVIHAR